MAALGSRALGIARSRTAAASEPAPTRRLGPLAWLPLVVIGAGLAFGLALWAKWGFLIAFETVRAYCF
jgi:hypothetical protein